jgi:hypothetical protein
VGSVARVGKRDMHTGFGGKCEGERPLGRPRCRWQDNIKWITLAQERDKCLTFLKAVMNLWVS